MSCRKIYSVKFLKKAFIVEPPLEAGNPTNKVIRNSIEAYFENSGKKLVFLDETKQVRFSIDGAVYNTEVSNFNGRLGYIITCTEE